LVEQRGPRIQETDAITEQKEVCLPTAAQWEQAARSHDDRPYPWGKTFVAAHANTQESGLGQTTPIHMYPQGATPEGVWDFCGNIWEWIADDEFSGKGGRRATTAPNAQFSTVAAFYRVGHARHRAGEWPVILPAIAFILSLHQALAL
jgi:formylglycine-generating enzyme required for sulfatase activity